MKIKGKGGMGVSNLTTMPKCNHQATRAVQYACVHLSYALELPPELRPRAALLDTFVYSGKAVKTMQDTHIY